MPAVIDIQGLGKQYRRSDAPPYLSLRELLRHPFRKKGHTRFWALEDINLQVAAGERIGIIGRNGAGKSTLLKILSRITPPTTGQVRLRGRLASLLEVGTGFHPELTGRENIYLNGSILGLSRQEINRNLPAIIDFSGVGPFLDTPLKHYSSGMELRLAFSVAAHLEPEILLIDEVLAVGDMEFQQKCLQKMEEVGRGNGRAVLFVSHNMQYIAALCERVVLLEGGKVVADGPAAEVVNTYLSGFSELGPDRCWPETQPGNEVVRLHRLRVCNADAQTKSIFPVDDPVTVEMEYEVRQAGHVLWLGYNVFNQQGINIFDTHSVNTAFYTEPHPAGWFTARAVIPPHLLNTGSFLIGAGIFNHLKGVIHLHERDAVRFQVHEVLDRPTARGLSPGAFPGQVRPLLHWDIKQQSR